MCDGAPNPPILSRFLSISARCTLNCTQGHSSSSRKYYFPKPILEALCGRAGNSSFWCRPRSAPVWGGRRCIYPSVGGQWQCIAQCPLNRSQSAVLSMGRSVGHLEEIPVRLCGPCRESVNVQHAAGPTCADARSKLYRSKSLSSAWLMSASPFL
jgi:hypothetical protein